MIIRTVRRVFALGGNEEATRLAGVSASERRGEHDVLRVDDVARVLPAALAAVETAGARVLELATHRATLDDVFLHLTGKDLRDG